MAEERKKRGKKPNEVLWKWEKRCIREVDEKRRNEGIEREEEMDKERMNSKDYLRTWFLVNKAMPIADRNLPWHRFAVDFALGRYVGLFLISGLAMGNAESSDSLATRHRAKSQSPVLEGNCGNVHASNACKDAKDASRQCLSVTPARRAKTCRQRSTRRKEVCRVTGLTLHQKALLLRKWNRMESAFTLSMLSREHNDIVDGFVIADLPIESVTIFLKSCGRRIHIPIHLATIYILGKRMFESIFKDNPHYLAYIDLKNEPNWNNHINFKIHVQRFVIALSEAMRRLREPSTSYDVLRDFGASYATYPKRVSPLYFERLANALSHTAARLQESDHLRVEVADSKSLPSFSMSKHRDSRSSLSHISSIKDSFQSECLGQFCCCKSSYRFAIILDHRHFQAFALGSISCAAFTSTCLDHDRNGICPITAEAWTVLSAFLANQVSVNTDLKQLLDTRCN
uniref:GLOBIN domain-containing protein n=1 Tax=Angiostrongylus cantonensis TaxID=6313 RepID=A0A158P9I3_ANGCA